MRGMLIIVFVAAVVAAIAAGPAAAGREARFPPGWNPFSSPIWFNQPAFEFTIEDTDGEALTFAVEHEYLELGNTRVYQSVEPAGWTIIVIPPGGMALAGEERR